MIAPTTMYVRCFSIEYSYNLIIFLLILVYAILTTFDTHDARDAIGWANLGRLMIGVPRMVILERQQPRDRRALTDFPLRL